MPDLEGIMRETRNFFVREVWEYPGKKGYALGNGIRAALGYVGYQYFDNDVLQLVCITYAAIKGVQFVKDVISYLW